MLFRSKIGDKCLVSYNQIESDSWHKKTIDWVGKHTIVFSDERTSEYATRLSAIKIKPLPDPVQEMLDVVDGLNDSYDCCRALYAAGYRKK